jgi:dihydroflavonol-4-reductase
LKDTDLELVKANLTEDGCFDEHVKDVEFVHHIASPFNLTSTNPQKEIIEPAIQGTLSILNACLKSKSIKRVILTSSIVALNEFTKRQR